MTFAPTAMLRRCAPSAMLRCCLCLSLLSLASGYKPAPLVHRREYLQYFATLPLLASTAAIADEATLQSEAADLGGNLLAFGPFGILSFGLKKQAAQQQECYDAGECADRVLYYKIECDRDDVECLARKRRLAASKINGFFDNPTSQPGILVFALFFFAGPISAVVRTIATLINGPNDEPPPDDPGEPPRKDSYGPGAPW